ncbi:MAG: STAS domain-containing protein [Deltaproteobacteria bacterium]|nr:STAS domain-containing protein [Deltaproteobacteria bacterium]
MFEYNITEETKFKLITAKGRIDALSAPEIHKIFNDLVLAGSRVLLVDLSSVHYISSAGLRIFIGIQKELKKVGGEIILAGIMQPVMEIFNVSGFTALFRFVAGREEAAALLAQGDTEAKALPGRETEKVSLTYLETDAPPGGLFVVGSQDKLESASYIAADVVTVNASRMSFGCGLAAIGENFDEYKNLFGEAFVIQNNFFFYPAVKQSAVDFILDAHRDPKATYQFLHGFGFNGAYRYVIAFKPQNGAVDLAALVQSFLTVSRADLIGVALIGESEGLWGMHMKKPPVIDRQTIDGENIFSSRRFAEWFDFPVEAVYAHHIVAAVGIAAREPGLLSPERQRLFSESHPFHFHGGVFEKAPLGNDVSAFENEMNRVFNDLAVYKIQHLLGQSMFAGGMAGIVELEA